MTEKEVQQAAKAINSLTDKACAMVRARKLNLTEKQKEVLSKVINDSIGACLDWRSEEALLKKGYIVKKPSHMGFNSSIYLINF